MPKSKGFFGPNRQRTRNIPKSNTAFGLDKDMLHHYIYFRHIATKQDVAFRAFLTKLSETFTCNWNEEHTLYRMDAIPRYRNTKRKISLGFKVLVQGTEDAPAALNQVQKLQSLLYPSWPESADDRSIKGSPIVGIKFSNLIARHGLAGKSQHLHGYISNLNVKFAHESGFIYAQPGWLARTVDEAVFTDDDVMKFTKGQTHASPASKVRTAPLIPQEIDISFEFSVLHQNSAQDREGYMGYRVTPELRDSGPLNEYWPYGVQVHKTDAYVSFEAHDGDETKILEPPE